MGGHDGPVLGEHRRLRLSTVCQLLPIRPKIRQHGPDRHHQNGHYQPTGDPGTIPTREQHGGRYRTTDVGGHALWKRRAGGHPTVVVDAEQPGSNQRQGQGRVHSVRVLLQPGVPRQGGGRIRLAPHHQDAGGRRGHTVDAILHIVRRAVLLVLSGVKKRVHDRQEEDSSDENRKPSTSDQV